MNYFDPETHKYYIDDIEVPGHTNLLPEQEFYVSKARLEELQEEGKEDHSLIKMYFDTKNTNNNPMLIALEKWLSENQMILGGLKLYEQPLFSKKLMFAGKPDSIFEKAINDFKRSFIDKYYHALQIALQQILAKENNIINKTKIWLITWFDGKEFKSKNVFHPKAENIAIGLIKKYWIEQATQKYLRGEI